MLSSSLGNGGCEQVIAHLLLELPFPSLPKENLFLSDLFIYKQILWVGASLLPDLTLAAQALGQRS